ncbi:MAG: hypothetical protein N3A71_00290 [Candidatus Dojkabacteria bacterium]|nr:hypothetical protein [Candidatus Dojkabacteria bacterium]
MLAFILISIWFWLGYIVVTKFLKIERITKCYSILDKKVSIDKWFLLFPASFLIGTLISNWIVYALAYLLQGANNKILISNIIFIVFLIILSLFVYRDQLIKFIKYKRSLNCLQTTIKLIRSNIVGYLKKNLHEILMILFFFIFASFLMFYSFRIEDDTILMGPSVYSDMSAHITMIRSFSFGDNIPTRYPFFYQDQPTIRYHFMFQFMVANLEIFGLPLDWAVNVPSILSLVSFLMLLYALSTLLFGKKLISTLVILFFIFRTGMGGFYYVNELYQYIDGGNLTKGLEIKNKFTNPLVMNDKEIDSVLEGIINTDFFMGKTQNEIWGLYNINVYANQRHLSFGMSIMLLILIFVIRDMLIFWRKLRYKLQNTISINKIKILIRDLFLTKSAWFPKDLWIYFVLGIILGLSGFWNGAVLISTLLILSVLTLFSRYKLRLVTLIILTCILFFLQVNFFIGSNVETNTETIIKFGYLADIPYDIQYNLHQLIVKKDWFEAFLYLSNIIPYVIKFIWDLLGVFALIVVILLIFKNATYRIIIISFLMPFLFAFTTNLAVEININHKYILISVVLLNIFIVYFFYRLSRSKYITKFIVVVLILAYIFTGILDFIAFVNLNNKKYAIKFDLNNEFYKWITKNTERDAVFVTGYVTVYPVGYAGRYYFAAWPYFAWSAGYDTYGREKILQSIYSASDIKELRKILDDNDIDYVIIDSAVLNNDLFEVNESIFRANYKLVYTSEDAVYGRVRVYDVRD